MSETPRTDAIQPLVWLRYKQAKDIAPENNASVAVEEMAYHARQLERELTAANERAARLEGDRARLDWLQKNTNWILCAETDPCGTFSIGRNDNFQNWALKVDSVRAAIDAAIRPDSAQKENKS